MGIMLDSVIQVPGKPRVCNDFRSQFSVHCKTRCGRITQVKTKYHRSSQNHRSRQPPEVEAKAKTVHKTFSRWCLSHLSDSSSIFLWANYEQISFLIFECVGSPCTGTHDTASAVPFIQFIPTEHCPFVSLQCGSLPHRCYQTTF